MRNETLLTTALATAVPLEIGLARQLDALLRQDQP